MAYQQPMRYQYDTSPRKLKPEYEPQKSPYSKKKKSTAKKQTKKTKIKTQQKPYFKVGLYILMGFTILFAISYRNSLITESFDRKENLKKELSSLQKENAQTEINIQSSLNLSNIEKSAATMLGMKKLDESQKVYVNLPKKDYVEPSSEQVLVTEEKGWFEQLIEKITNFIK